MSEEQRHHNGFLFSIVEEQGRFKVKCRPEHDHGFMFYAYNTQAEAEQVIRNLMQGSFDWQHYRVNFAPDNGRHSKSDWHQAS